MSSVPDVYLTPLMNSLQNRQQVYKRQGLLLDSREAHIVTFVQRFNMFFSLLNQESVMKAQPSMQAQMFFIAEKDWEAYFVYLLDDEGDPTELQRQMPTEKDWDLHERMQTLIIFLNLMDTMETFRRRDPIQNMFSVKEKTVYSELLSFMLYNKDARYIVVQVPYFVGLRDEGLLYEQIVDKQFDAMNYALLICKNSFVFQIFRDWTSAGRTVLTSDAALLLQRISEQSYIVQKNLPFDLQLPILSLEQQQDLQMASERQYKHASPSQKEAVLFYTSEGKGVSYDLNVYLRTSTIVDRLQDLNVFEYERRSYLNDIVEGLDSVLCDSTLPTLDKPIFVYRGIATENFDIHQTNEDRGQKSTTLNPAVALSFCKQMRTNTTCVLLQIELPAGQPIFRVPQEGSRFSESEILLSRGTTFRPMPGSFEIRAAQKTIKVIRLRAIQNCE